MKKILFRRNGDINLIPVKKSDIPQDAKIVKHNGSFIMARGEATGSLHTITVERPQDLIIKEDAQGRRYFEVLAEGKLAHTSDHETTVILPDVYVQVPEREVDHFSESIVRRVID